jgi:hypothetical protein
MRGLLKIASFLLLLLLLTAEDCSDRAIEFTFEERQTAMFQNIENEFEKEELRPEALEAFENRSLQMVTELVDYLNISADSSLSKEFRLQAKDMLMNLFQTRDEFETLLSAFNLLEDKENEIINTEGVHSVHFQLRSVSISESLAQQQDFSYSGNIKFELSSNTAEIKQQERLLEIRLLKTQKQFGGNSVRVWDLYFGGIIN